MKICWTDMLIDTALMAVGLAWAFEGALALHDGRWVSGMGDLIAGALFCRIAALDRFE